MRRDRPDRQSRAGRRSAALHPPCSTRRAPRPAHPRSCRARTRPSANGSAPARPTAAPSRAPRPATAAGRRSSPRSSTATRSRRAARFVSPSTATRSPARRNTPAQVALHVGQQAHHADRRRREDALAFGLVVEADVPADDRDVRARGTLRRCRASASANCHMISGRSGLPKLRQSVRPSGSPPTQETFRAHSATASRAPSNGSRKHEAGVAVHRQRQALLRPLDAHHRRVAGPGRTTRAEPDHVVVLPDTPTPCWRWWAGRAARAASRRGHVPARHRERIELLQRVLPRRAATWAGRRSERRR